jgi:phosphoribosyl 1,2-cyclic phosphodiesterase
LGSGSSGNALIIEAGTTRLLLDCGFGPRELARRLARLGLEGGDVDAIVVTHEHTDHAAGVLAAAKKFNLGVFLTHGTRAAIVAMHAGAQALTVIDSGQAFAIGDIEVRPFPVPHDAREPVQFVFADGSHRLGVFTDAGCATPHIVSMLSGCDALVLECNHDAAMLEAGDYPPLLKQRIRGHYGHLDNAAAAALLASLDGSRLRHVVAAHLSRQNNTPGLARDALARALGCEPAWIGLASQDEGFAWREIR